jgi:transposase
MLVPGPSGNAQPVSSITAISINGYLGGTVIDVGADGNVDTEAFLKALEEDIIPHTNRYNPMAPPENSFIIFDNARTHDKLRIVLLCERFGVKSLFLPPYSYDLSPIELFFNTALIKLKRNSRGNTISLKDQWLDALQNSSTPQNCLQYYEKCFLFE